MPRGGSRSSGSRGGSSPFGSKPASAPPRAAPAPAPAAAKPAPAAAHPPASHPPAAAPSSGPGLLGMMASSAAGSVAGHYIANSLFGNSSQAPSVPPQTQQAIDSDYGACAPSFKNFLSCVEANEQDIANCQWAYGAFAQCQKNTQPM